MGNGDGNWKERNHVQMEHVRDACWAFGRALQYLHKRLWPPLRVPAQKRNTWMNASVGICEGGGSLMMTMRMTEQEAEVVVVGNGRKE